MSILDEVQQTLGQDKIAQISQQIGASPAQTHTAVQAAVPMLLGGMAGTASQPNGAGEIQQLLGSHAGILGSLGGLLGGGGAPADGGGILGKVLGQHQQTVQQGVQQAGGLDSNQTRHLLMILAPIVLGILAKRHANASHDQLQTQLQQEAQTTSAQAQKSAPHVGGILGKILDQVQGH